MEPTDAPKKRRSLWGTLGLVLFGCVIVLMFGMFLSSRGGNGTAAPTVVRAATLAIVEPTTVRATATSAPTIAPSETPVTEPRPTEPLPTEPAPTAEPPTDVPPTATNAPAGPTVAKDANLRAGPGTGFAKTGAVQAGDELRITGRNEAGDWFELADGGWIAAFLVANAPGTVPVAAVIPALPTQQPASAPARSGTVVVQPNAFVCAGGCAVAPDPSCAIKGNVNSKGERIYHKPGWRDYDKTNIRPDEGDRWFCTADEAVAAGFRAPLNP